MQVTADCIDPLYTQPVIDSETDETSPVPHHRVSGHFEGTNSIQHLPAPPGGQGEVGRAILPVHLPDRVHRAEHRPRERPGHRFRASERGLRGAAGKAPSHSDTGTRPPRKFAKTVAASYYGSDRQIFGYLYGPSGGSFQTVGAAENTDGVWQGFVPMVQGVPTPSSYNFKGRSAAELILGDKAAQIRDALLPEEWRPVRNTGPG